MDKATEAKLAKARKMSVENFVTQAIEKLRTKGYKGVHSVYSGLNDTLRLVYPDKDPIKIVNELVENHNFGRRYVKGGALIFLPKDAKEAKEKAQANAATKTIARIIA